MAKDTADLEAHFRKGHKREQERRVLAEQEVNRKKRAEQRARMNKASEKLNGIDPRPKDVRANGHAVPEARPVRHETIVQHMHRRFNTYTDAELRVAEMVGVWSMVLQGRSVGVSAHGYISSRNPWDIAGKKLIEVESKAKVRQKLEKLLYAMFALPTSSGQAIFDEPRAVILVYAATNPANSVTLTEIGRLFSSYTGEKQVSPVGATVLKEKLREGAMHLGFEKGNPWDRWLKWVADVELAARLLLRQPVK